jgi:UDP-N-acetyl-D-mannosaminuronic acid dehydrogenase
MSLNEFKRISLIGLGYIGLPTSARFNSRKVKVNGIDVNQQAVDMVKRGMIHIVEPDLDMVARAAVEQGINLRITDPP